MISRGVSLERLTAELFGREGGFCNGVSGTHTACMEKGVMSKTGILGAGLPIAVGVALSIKLRKMKRVVAVFIGDGASSSGNFHEALNMASIWNLPVVFVLENNKYAWTTPTDYALAVKQLSVRASAYGIPGYTIDGNDLLKVYETSLEAVERSRNGEGPSLLECKTYRIMGHYGPGMDYELKYRTDEEIDAWRTRDPLRLFRKYLVDRGVTERELRSVETIAKIKVKKAVEFAIDSSFPSRETVLRLCKTEA